MKRITAVLFTVVLLFLCAAGAACAESSPSGLHASARYVNTEDTVTVEYCLPEAVSNAGAVSFSASFNNRQLRLTALSCAEIPGMDLVITDVERANETGRITGSMIAEEAADLQQGEELFTAEFSTLLSMTGTVRMEEAAVYSSEGFGELAWDGSTSGGLRVQNITTRRYIDGISFSQPEGELWVGFTKTLAPDVEGIADYSRFIPLQYASSSPEVASVDENGVLTGLSEGTAVITVTGAQYSAEYTANVIERPEHTVTVNSVCNGFTGTALLEGGGRYLENEEITVTAHEMAYGDFLGWYDTPDSSGNRLSRNMAYTFTVTEDSNLYALYEAKGDVKLSLEGDAYTVNGTEYTADAEVPVAYGSPVTLIYTGEAEFIGWRNAAGYYVARERELLLPAAFLPYELTAVTAEGETGEHIARVEFLSGYGQMVSCGIWAASDTTEEHPLPAGPYYSRGKIFAGWSLDGRNAVNAAGILSAINGTKSVITLTPLYRDNEAETVQLTLRYAFGDTTEENSEILTAGASVVLTAPERDGYIFSRWVMEANGTEKTLSTEKSLRFQANTGMKLTAVYTADMATQPEPVPVIAITGCRTEGADHIVFDATRSVPANYTVVDQGFLRSTDSTLMASAETNLRLNAGGTAPNGVVKRSQAGASVARNATAVYSLNIGSAFDVKVFARGYMILRDENDFISVYYSDVASGSYNTISAEG